MKKTYWLSLIFVCLSFSSEKPLFLAENVSFYKVDQLGQIFVVQNDNSVSKFTPDGKLAIAKNLKIQGALAYLDVKNSFEYLFFYKNLNTLITTDNLFNQRATLNFNENEFLSSKQIAAVNRSFDNHIWAFDLVSQRLLKINPQGKILLESSSLPSQKGLHNVQWIIEMVPYVFLVDTSEIITLNIYGKVLETQHLTDKVEQATVKKDTLLLNTTDFCWKYWQEGNQFVLRKIDLKTSDRLFLKGDSLFLQPNL